MGLYLKGTRMNKAMPLNNRNRSLSKGKIRPKVDDDADFDESVSQISDISATRG